MGQEANLELRLKRQVELEKEIVEKAHKSFEGVRNIYYADFLVFGALDRLLANSIGFKLMIESKLFPCAAALVRMQIDIAMRIHALALVDDKDGLAKFVMDGNRLSKWKSRDGKRLTDAFLIESLEQEAKWVGRVYEATSAFVHLSDRHIWGAVHKTDNAGTVQLAITGIDRPRPESSYYEAVDGFFEATKLSGLKCLSYLRYRQITEPDSNNS